VDSIAPDTSGVRLAELVAALSLGIDLGFGQPMEHVLRQCLISLHLAEKLELADEEKVVVYYTALLLTVGCHSDAHEQAKWFGDDFALKATNTSGHTSGFSQEQNGYPTFVRGLKSPRFIGDLRVAKSGPNDANLTWGVVTTDIYGKAETVQRYEVYRGTLPSFLPSAGNRIAQPTVATYPDGGALLAGVPYYYLVRAVDVDGNVGGLGSQLPNGIDTLSVTDGTTPGDVRISWPAVVTDFDGAPITVNHYELYSRSTPFSRADIRNGTIPLLASTTALTATVTPPAANAYYSVIAVDAKGNTSPF